MASSDTAISVRGLGKAYTIAHNQQRHTTAAEALMHRVRHPFELGERETFWALKDVSFDIRKGEVSGIIGRNGAGKSTLLKILSRITEPTTGEIDLYGRVGSLLEVGTGFHAELTGRENIYLNGAILGMKRREIERQFDAIVDFSGVEQFLDTPVKRYSSGMYVRLAFAVAAHLNPDILLVDEVLAVGDAEFQKKCLGKMKEVSTEQGRTVLFVSHNMQAIAGLCRTGLVLNRGVLQKQGDVAGVIGYYQSTGEAMAQAHRTLENSKRKGSGRALFTEVSLKTPRCSSAGVPILYPGEDLEVRATVRARSAVAGANAAVTIHDGNHYRLIDFGTALKARYLDLGPGDVVSVTFVVRDLLLKPAMYSVSLWLGCGGTEEIDDVEDATAFVAEFDPETVLHAEVFPGPYQARFSVEIERQQEEEGLRQVHKEAV